jgi:hypothetical protein
LDLPALFVDIDFKHHPEALARRDIAKCNLPPSIIVSSGHGLHCYWLLREPLDLQDADDVRLAYDLLQRLAAVMHGDAGVAEPARIMRVPRSLNLKNPEAPITVEIEWLNAEQRYNPGDLLNLLPRVETVAPSPISDRSETISDGSRNARLHRIGRGLHAKGVGVDGIRTSLAAINGAQCRPPLDEQEIGAIASQCARQRDRTDFAEQQTVAVLSRADSIVPVPVCWVMPGRIARGKTTLIAGHPGVGKSQLTCDIAATVSTGGLWPDGSTSPRGSVVLLSAEDASDDTVVPRLMAAGADLTRVYILTAIRDVDDSGQPIERAVRLDRDIAVLADAIARIGDVVLVVIDPVSAYMGGADTHRTSDVRAVLAPVERLAQRFGVAVVAVSHLNKGGGAEAIARVTGSMAFVAAARSASLVVRDPDDETRRLWLSVKSNLAGEPDGLAYTITSATVWTAAGHAIDTSRVQWCEGMVNLRADEALAQQAAPEERTARDEAVEWLQQALADGPQPRDVLERQARADGMSWRTVHRGAKVLDVTMTRPGFGARSTWSLPAPFVPVVPPNPQSCHVREMAQLDSVGTTGRSTADLDSSGTAMDESTDRGESPSEIEGGDATEF